MTQAAHAVTGTASTYGLDREGVRRAAAQYWNLTAPLLYEHAIRRREGEIAAGGAFVARTGKFTGRTPRDKYFVEEASSKDEIWWGGFNKPIGEPVFERMLERVRAYFQGKELFVQDLHGGADPAYRLKVRVVSDSAWHSLFVRNMFIRPKLEELHDFVPDFTILHAPKFFGDAETDGTESDTFILVNFGRRLVLIGGTEYAGEIKKCVFGYLNFMLPAKGVLPMHCSVNVGPRGDSAVFFGLSGTGKTTLSADGSRTLIGDDEHGWSDRGLFNFEGGCYAKAINLSAAHEPEIYAATHRFGTVLENVVIDPLTRIPDLTDASLTENTRACYPLDFIPNADVNGVAPHPENVIMLTADAFGVLPPIARMSPEQAMYHFLSGYTAQIAGTEVGVNEPKATFSTCFGAPFMPRHPSVYAKMLGERIEKTGATCWLVNTGWSGGAYGVGSRMKIAYSRALVRAALAGKLKDVPVRKEPFFGLLVPESCPEVPNDVLTARNTWSDKGAYDQTARDLTKRFETNFKKFEEYVGPEVKKAAIYAAA
ncbi:MAG TPA: phosphoenolpyruvate carboxykinase [Stellaceae bacterium]|nr:phosphoenolpyruvate carboxykinase [Stellaceae bacterium]